MYFLRRKISFYLKEGAPTLNKQNNVGKPKRADCTVVLMHTYTAERSYYNRPADYIWLIDVYNIITCKYLYVFAKNELD